MPIAYWPAWKFCHSELAGELALAGLDQEAQAAPPSKPSLTSATGTRPSPSAASSCSQTCSWNGVRGAGMVR